MRTAVVTACSADWIPFACATLMSAAENTGIRFDPFILTEALPSDFTRILEKASENIGSTIKIKQVDERVLQGCNAPRIHLSSLYRICLDTLIPRDFDRILYLDSDVLVLGNIDKLLSYDLKSFPVGAVEDFAQIWTKQGIKVKKALGIDQNGSYFNAGVLLIDWQQLQTTTILSDTRELLKLQSFRFADQCALNLALVNKWCKLPLAYNVLGGAERFVRPKIVHFAGVAKPWKKKCHFEDRFFKEVYRRYLKEIECEHLVEEGHSKQRGVGTLVRIISAFRNLVTANFIQRRFPQDPDEFQTSARIHK